MSAKGTRQIPRFTFAPFALFADPNALEFPGDMQ